MSSSIFKIFLVVAVFSLCLSAVFASKQNYDEANYGATTATPATTTPATHSTLTAVIVTTLTLVDGNGGPTATVTTTFTETEKAAVNSVGIYKYFIANAAL